MTFPKDDPNYNITKNEFTINEHFENLFKRNNLKKV